MEIRLCLAQSIDRDLLPVLSAHPDCRATHGGVKWVRGKNIKPLSPGLHIYWPLTTEVEVMVTARQTLAIPDQVLATKDGKKVVVKTLVVYKIRDVVHAIGRVNWDVDTTINDLTQSAVVRVVATHTYEEIMKAIADESMTTTLTKEVRKELRPFGVHIVRSKLVDFAECKVFKLMTESGGQGGDGARAVLSVAGRTGHCWHRSIVIGLPAHPVLPCIQMPRMSNSPEKTSTLSIRQGHSGHAGRSRRGFSVSRS